MGNTNTVIVVCLGFFYLLIFAGNALDPNQLENTDVLASRNCSKYVRPNHRGPPVKVGVAMHVLDISSISEENMEFQLDLLFRQYWKDTCLLPLEKTITLSTVDGPPIWIPDTFFVNEKNSYLRPTSPSSEFIRVDKSGQVVYSKRVSLTASCRFDLHNFPMDRQTCQIDIESYGHTTDDIKYDWNYGDQSVGISDEIMLPQFKILRHKLKQMETDIPEKYSRLTVEFRFKRFIGRYVMQVFLPSALIVLISFASMWINHTFTSIRITLSAITFLTIAILASNINATLPKVSYITATDVYLFGCLIMVACSVFEVTAASYMVKTTQMKINLLNKIMTLEKKDKLINGSFEKIEESEYYCDADSLDEKDEMKNASMLPNMMDVYSRFLFPIVFIIFNIIFWLYYSTFSWQ